MVGAVTPMSAFGWGTICKLLLLSTVAGVIATVLFPMKPLRTKNKEREAPWLGAMMQMEGCNIAILPACRKVNVIESALTSTSMRSCFGRRGTKSKDRPNPIAPIAAAMAATAAINSHGEASFDCPMSAVGH